MKKETRKSISSEDLATFHTTPHTHQPTQNQHGSENILNTGFHFAIQIPNTGMQKVTRKSISSEGLETFHTTPRNHPHTQKQHGRETFQTQDFTLGSKSLMQACRKQQEKAFPVRAEQLSTQSPIPTNPPRISMAVKTF